jgi:hypothetical protein
MSLNNIILEYRKDIIRMSLGSPALKKSINTSLKKALESGLIRNIDKNGKKLLTGADVLNAYKLGNLSRGANAKVVKYLFQSVDDINFKTTIAKKMMGESQNIVKYSKLTSQQATTELKKLGYNPEEIKLLKSVFTNQGKTNNYGFKKPGTITPTTTTTTTPTWTDIKYWQGGNVIKWSDDEIKSFLNIKKPIHEKIRNYFILFTKDIEKAKENLKKLFDARKNTTDTALRNKIDEKIINEFKILSNAKQKTFKEITTVLDEVGTEDKVWRETWNKIKGQNSDLFKSLSDPADKTYFYQKTFKFLGEVLNDFMNSAKSMLNLITLGKIKGLSGSKGSLMNTIKSGTRIGFPKKSNELYKTTFEYGGKTSARMRYVANLMIQGFVLNVTIAVVESVTQMVSFAYSQSDMLGCAEELKKGEKNGEYCSKIMNKNFIEKFLFSQALEYSTNPEGRKGVQKTYSVFLENLFKTYVKNENMVALHPYENLVTSLIPGYIDNILIMVYKLFINIPEWVNSTETRNRIKTQLSTIQQNLIQDAEENGRIINNEIQNVIQPDTSEPGTPASNTLEDFKETHSDPNAKDLGNGIYQLSDGRNFKWNGEYYEMQ